MTGPTSYLLSSKVFNSFGLQLVIFGGKRSTGHQIVIWEIQSIQFWNGAYNKIANRNQFGMSCGLPFEKKAQFKTLFTEMDTKNYIRVNLWQKNFFKLVGYKNLPLHSKMHLLQIFSTAEFFGFDFGESFFSHSVKKSDLLSELTKLILVILLKSKLNSRGLIYQNFCRFV